MLSPYLTRTTDVDELLAAERLIVKFVRGNLLLPWVVSRFTVPKPVLLVRHPCAVVSSQIKFGAWDSHALVPRPRPHRFDRFIEQYRAILDDIRTVEERQAAYWCIDHKHLLEHPENDRAWTTITYEEMILRPEATLNKVFHAWGIPVPNAALDRLRQPSSTTLAGSRVRDPKEQLRQWRTKLDDQQIGRILGIVDRFGIDLYDHTEMPRRTFTP